MIEKTFFSKQNNQQTQKTRQLTKVSRFSRTRAAIVKSTKNHSWILKGIYWKCWQSVELLLWNRTVMLRWNLRIKDSALVKKWVLSTVVLSSCMQLSLQLLQYFSVSLLFHLLTFFFVEFISVRIGWNWLILLNSTRLRWQSTESWYYLFWIWSLWR